MQIRDLLRSRKKFKATITTPKLCAMESERVVNK